MAKKILEAVLAGQMILNSLRAVTSKYVKEERVEFERSQGALAEADARAHAADKVVKEAIEASHVADQAQDEATAALASRLVGDGFDRRNPFKAFGIVSPSLVVSKRPVAQAQTLIRMAQAIQTDPQAKADSKKAAQVAVTAAKAVLQANTRKVQANLARTKSRIEDEHLAGEWQDALTNLREALRYADHKEHTQLYDVVFAEFNQAKAQSKKKQAVEPEPLAPVI